MPNSLPQFQYQIKTEPAATLPPNIGLSTGSWSQPPPRIRQVQYQALAICLAIAEVITPDKWFSPLSTPVRVSRDVRAVVALAASGPVQGEWAQFPENVTEDRWHQPFTDPPIFLAKRGLSAGQQQFIAYSESAQFSESITEDRWHQPFSDPPHFLAKRSLGPRYQQTIALSPVEALPEVSGEPRFHQPWSEPAAYLKKRGLAPQLQQFLAYSESAQFPENVSEDRWHLPWSEPAAFLRKRGLATHQQRHWTGVDSAPETVTSDKWFANLSEPVRVKIDPRRATAIATSGPFYSESAQFAETVTEDRWHQPWADPIRHWARRFNPTHQQFATIGQPPIVSFSWYEALNEPVRVRAPLRQTLEPTYNNNDAPIVNIGWWNDLSQPVRIVPPRQPGLATIPPSGEAEIIPPGPPGAGKRKDFPSYIPQPAYEAKKNPPFRPVWDERRRRAAQAILDEEKRRTAPAIPMPPAEVFQRQAPGSYPMPGQIDPAQSKLIAQQSQDARDIADINDAMSALQSDRQDAQDAVDILSIL